MVLAGGVLLALAAQSSEAFAASWAPGLEAGLPANAALTPIAYLTSVSCASAGNCSAVGYYYDGSVSQQGLLLTETAGTWATGVEASPPANAGSNPAVHANSVSRGAAGHCSAGGHYTDNALHGQGLLLTETAGTWATGVEACLPANAGTCTAVNLVSV